MFVSRDPLEIGVACQLARREFAYLIDHARWVARAKAVAAVALFRRQCPAVDQSFVREQLLLARDQLLEQDRARAAFDLDGDDLEASYGSLAEALGVPCSIALDAANVFNGLADTTRRCFWYMVIEQQTAEETARELGMTAASVLKHVQHAALALSLLRDPDLPEEPS